MHPALIVFIVLAAIVLVLFFVALAVVLSVFGRRCDKNPLLKYFTAEEFGLDAEPVSKGIYKGYIYKKPHIEQKDKLIIFCHGMGPGHIAYTTEIAHFCNFGYTVLALDNRGCNFSEGKTMQGMYAGVKAAVAAIDFACEREDLKYYEMTLVGHSWGAYSALCASYERGVDSVVALSAPNTPSKMFEEATAAVLSKPVAVILRPFYWFVNLIIFGAKGNACAVKRILKSKTPALIVHGDKDKTVTIKSSAFEKADGDNVEKFVVNGKFHNPYNTVFAEGKLVELAQLLHKSRKMTEEEKEVFATFDYVAATREDPEVMRVIDEFIARN